MPETTGLEVIQVDLDPGSPLGQAIIESIEALDNTGLTQISNAYVRELADCRLPYDFSKFKDIDRTVLKLDFGIFIWLTADLSDVEDRICALFAQKKLEVEAWCLEAAREALHNAAEAGVTEIDIEDLEEL